MVISAREAVVAAVSGAVLPRLGSYARRGVNVRERGRAVVSQG